MFERIIFATLTILLLLAFFLPVKDTDFGWHYRCGEEFITQGKLCLQNEYAYFLPNYKWANPNFVYDISLALVYDHFGFVGVSILGSIVLTVIFLLFFSILKGPHLFRIIAISLVSVLSLNVLTLGYRSQTLGLLFVMVELFLLQGLAFRKASPSIRRGLLRLPFKIAIMTALFLLWANSHPSFFLGPLILACYTIEKIVRVLLDKSNLYQSKARNLISPSVLFLIPTLATLINPFGLRIYQEVLQHFQSPLGQMIAEWTTPDWWQVVLMIMITIVVISLIVIRKIPTDFRLPLLLIFAYFAILARRNLPLYYIIAFWLLCESSMSFNITEKTKRIFQTTTLVTLFLGILVFTLQISKTLAFDTNFSVYIASVKPRAIQNTIPASGVVVYCQDGQIKLPCQALERLKDKTGNLFNMYEQGGFLIWQLPQMKIFADGRMPAWKDENGKSPYQVYLEIIQAQPGWNEQLIKYKTDYLLINSGTFLDLLLQEKGAKTFGWQQDYRDQLSVIYRK